MIRPFLIALQFLTRLPVRFNGQPSAQDIGRSLFYYPLVGLIIAALLVLLGGLLYNAPPFIAAALLVTAWILLTGGLHLDGLADSADAWLGGMGDPEKILAIMKDPTSGTAGITAILLIILLKFSALHWLIMSNQWTALFLAVIFARTQLPVLIITTPYVRRHGLGAILSEHHPKLFCTLAVVITLILTLLITRLYGLWLLFFASLVFLILRHMMLNRIGGTTVDTAGALVEITETTVLLIAALSNM